MNICIHYISTSSIHWSFQFLGKNMIDSIKQLEKRRNEKRSFFFYLILGKSRKIWAWKGWISWRIAKGGVRYIYSLFFIDFFLLAAEGSLVCKVPHCLRGNWLRTDFKLTRALLGRYRQKEKKKKKNRLSTWNPIIYVWMVAYGTPLWALGRKIDSRALRPLLIYDLWMYLFTHVHTFI